MRSLCMSLYPCKYRIKRKAKSSNQISLHDEIMSEFKIPSVDYIPTLCTFLE